MTDYIKEMKRFFLGFWRKRSVFVLFLVLITQLTFARKTAEFPTNAGMQGVLDSMIDKGDFAGIITVVATAHHIESLNCAGYQDAEQRLKMKPNTLFWIASQSKPIAATAVMMLVDDGKVDLDAPVEKYLPELKRLVVSTKWTDSIQVEQRVHRPVTLRRLLSHTAGLKWVGGVQEKMGVIDVVPLQVAVYVTAMTPLEAVPGTRFIYSNQGINVAAAIVERVSGMPYEEFLQKRLFTPLGMINTTFWPSKGQQKQLAVPYEKINGKLTPTTVSQLQYPLEDKMKRHPEAAGGLFSTPEDLVKFYQMIAGKGVYKGKRFLSENSVNEMGKKQTGDKVDAFYGLGWTVSKDEMSHGGSYGTDSRVNRETGWITMYFVQEKGLDKENSQSIDMFISKVKEVFDLSEVIK